MGSPKYLTSNLLPIFGRRSDACLYLHKCFVIYAGPSPDSSRPRTVRRLEANLS